MIVGTRRLRTGIIATAVFSLIVAAAGPAAAEGISSRSEAAANMEQEANARALQALADANGALGMYVDGLTGQYVVVFPRSQGAQLGAAALAATKINARTETRPIDAETIAKIDASLLALHPVVQYEAPTTGSLPSLTARSPFAPSA